MKWLTVNMWNEQHPMSRLGQVSHDRAAGAAGGGKKGNRCGPRRAWTAVEKKADISPLHTADHGVSEVSLLQRRSRVVMQNDVFASSDKTVPWIGYNVHLESARALSPQRWGSSDARVRIL